MNRVCKLAVCLYHWVSECSFINHRDEEPSRCRDGGEVHQLWKQPQLVNVHQQFVLLFCAGIRAQIWNVYGLLTSNLRTLEIVLLANLMHQMVCYSHLTVGRGPLCAVGLMLYLRPQFMHQQCAVVFSPLSVWAIALKYLVCNVYLLTAVNHITPVICRALAPHLFLSLLSHNKPFKWQDVPFNITLRPHGLHMKDFLQTLFKFVLGKSNDYRNKSLKAQ